MDFGATNFTAPYHFSLLNALESLPDIRERGRNRFVCCRDTKDGELVCPMPHRAGSGIPATPLDTSVKSCRRLRGATPLPVIGEAGSEILDILYSKVSCGDNNVSGSPNVYLKGSPPRRANNPMIHDSQFTLKPTVSLSLVVPQKSLAVPQKSSCDSSVGSSVGGSGSAKSSSALRNTGAIKSCVSKPLRRVEGFAAAPPDSNRGVPAYA